MTKFTFIFFILIVFVNSVNAQFFRWQRTATDGEGLLQGDPTIVTWGIVADGVTIQMPQDHPFEVTGPSDLIGFLDTNFGTGPGGMDLTKRPWFDLFLDPLERIGEVSGLEFQYEFNDLGVDISPFIFVEGTLGLNPDTRIGGHAVDGIANTLAYAYGPNNGEVVVDTDDFACYLDPTGMFLAFRNKIVHEICHTVGLRHLISDDSNHLLEPNLNLDFDGPQIDDIHQLQRRYGDRFEKNGGNDFSNTASTLGLFNGTALRIGGNAAMNSVQEVLPFQKGFVSIDGSSDLDFWSFSLNREAEITVTLAMVGPSYLRRLESQEKSENEIINLSEQSDLGMALVNTNGLSVLEFSDNRGLNVDEEIQFTLSPGEYFIFVYGTGDATQFYDLRVDGFFTNACSFNEPVDYMASDPFASTLEDFNADGNQDLAVANRLTSEISIYINSGNSTFRTPNSYVVGSRPESIVAADLDGDGDFDLAVANELSDDITILLNDGNGGFSTGGTYSVLNQPNAIAFGDLDNDGDLDLVTANRNFPNQGTVSVLFNTGDGSFSNLVSYLVGQLPEDVEIADFDNDGDYDMAVANANSNNISFLQNLGNGEFDPLAINLEIQGLSPQSLTIGDFNNDSTVDLAVANEESSNISIIRNLGGFQFVETFVYAVPGNPISIDSTDVDLDECLDLVVATQNNTISVLEGRITGAFGSADNFPAAMGTSNVSTGDLDDDGDIDIVVCGEISNSFGVLTNTCIDDFLLGDINFDETVDLLDVAPFVVLITSGKFLEEADINMDGEVNTEDVTPFVVLLTSD